jgi:hypothetical protein
MATKGFVIIKTEVMEVKGKRTMVEGLGGSDLQSTSTV